VWLRGGRLGGGVPVSRRRTMTLLPHDLPPRDARRRSRVAARHRLLPHRRLKTGEGPRAWTSLLSGLGTVQRGRGALSLLLSLALPSCRLLRTSWVWPLWLALVVPGPWCRQPWSANSCLTILGWELRIPMFSDMTLRTLWCASGVVRTGIGYFTPRQWVPSFPCFGVLGGGHRWLLEGPSSTECWLG
jgi:hypothetical protein